MTVKEAFQELVESAAYSNIAKEKNTQGSKYRVMRSRFAKDELDYLAMINMLLEYGYEISVKKKED